MVMDPISDTNSGVDSHEMADSICDDFILDWKAGKQYPLDRYLQGVREQERADCFNRLMAIREGFLIESTADGQDDVESDKVPLALNDRYELRSLLGKGSFGEVWCAYDRRLKRYIAVKILRSDRQFSAETQKAFLKEGERLARLSHPGIVAVHDVGIEETRRYIVSELIRGMTLNQYCQKNQLSYTESASLVRRIADTLHHAHLRGVVHRDLKPANIMVTADGDPRIVDFGLATTEEEQLDEPSQILGTYPYMSPEQIRGESHLVDPRTDIYSLGVILYELLTNRRPFEGKTLEQYAEQILHREPRPLRTIDDSIPVELETICLKCLEKEPKNRFLSCRDLKDALERVCHFRTTPRLSRLKTAFAVTILLLSFCGLGAIAWYGSSQSNSPDNSVKVWEPKKLVPRTDKPRNQLQIVNLLTDGRAEANRFEIMELTNELQLIAPDKIVVKAGILDEETKTLEMNVSQHHWPGDVGVILGYLNPSSDNRHQYHVIEIDRRKDGSYILLRYTTKFHLETFGSKTNYMKAWYEIEIQPSGNRLSLRFEDGFLSRVDWNDKTLEQNETPVDDRSEDERITGPFGFYARDSVATFSSIRIDGQPQKLTKY